jgi:AcrR family transcriptional regulator
VSRVTVYAHFATWEALLEAVVERAVGHTTAVLAAGDGPVRGRTAMIELKRECC